MGGKCHFGRNDKNEANDGLDNQKTQPGLWSWLAALSQDVAGPSASPVDWGGRTWAAGGSPASSGLQGWSCGRQARVHTDILNAVTEENLQFSLSYLNSDKCSLCPRRALTRFPVNLLPDAAFVFLETVVLTSFFLQTHDLGGHTGCLLSGCVSWTEARTVADKQIRYDGPSPLHTVRGLGPALQRLGIDFTLCFVSSSSSNLVFRLLSELCSSPAGAS